MSWACTRTTTSMWVVVGDAITEGIPHVSSSRTGRCAPTRKAWTTSYTKTYSLAIPNSPSSGEAACTGRPLITYRRTLFGRSCIIWQN